MHHDGTGFSESMDSGVMPSAHLYYSGLWQCDEHVFDVCCSCSALIAPQVGFLICRGFSSAHKDIWSTAFPEPRTQTDANADAVRKHAKCRAVSSWQASTSF